MFADIDRGGHRPQLAIVDRIGEAMGESIRTSNPRTTASGWIGGGICQVPSSSSSVCRTVDNPRTFRNRVPASQARGHG